MRMRVGVRVRVRAPAEDKIHQPRDLRTRARVRRHVHGHAPRAYDMCMRQDRGRGPSGARTSNLRLAHSPLKAISLTTTRSTVNTIPYRCVKSEED